MAVAVFCQSWVRFGRSFAQGKRMVPPLPNLPIFECEPQCCFVNWTEAEETGAIFSSFIVIFLHAEYQVVKVRLAFVVGDATYRSVKIIGHCENFVGLGVHEYEFIRSSRLIESDHVAMIAKATNSEFGRFTTRRFFEVVAFVIRRDDQRATV
jgi:hypothetical protein